MAVMSLEQTNGGGPRGEGLQLFKAGHAAFEHVIALDDPFLLDREPGRLPSPRGSRFRA